MSINLDNIDTTYVLSDIHGDIWALILALYKCTGTVIGNIDNCAKHLEKNCNDPSYDPMLGLRWNHAMNNTMIVLIGDIIDNARLYGGVKTSRNTEIEHEEIKILLFLRAIDNNASGHGSGVITLIGNHEDMNINMCQVLNIGSKKMYTHLGYITDYSLAASPYKGRKRDKVFDRKTYKENDNHGIDLYRNKSMGNKIAVIAKVNDFIFVHGGINTKTSEAILDNIEDNSDLRSIVDKINDEYNKYVFGEGDDGKKMYNKVIGTNIWNTGLLWDRSNDSRKGDICATLHGNLNRLCSVNDAARAECEKNLVLVVGHCPQNTITTEERTGTTYSDIDNINLGDGHAHLISGEPYTGKAVIPRIEGKSVGTMVIFGQSMDCPLDEPGRYRLYRVDVAMSRCFDTVKHINDGISDDELFDLLMREYATRAPQVLRIKKNKQLRGYHTDIIRCRLNDVVKYQHRDVLGVPDSSLRKKVMRLANIISGHQ